MSNTGAMDERSDRASRPPGGEVERDAAPARRSAPVRVALIALASDHGIRGELEVLFGRRAELRLARVSSPDRYDMDSLAATTGGIGRAIRSMGLGSPVDVAAYGCTSATILVGEDTVARSLDAALPGVPATTPITAARAALARLGAHRLALLTPYPAAIHRAVVDYMSSHGFDVIAERGLGIGVDRDITEYPAKDLRAAILGLDRRNADAIFVSCTSVRIATALDELESATRLPVVTSNQALAWHSLQLAGQPANISGFGQLLAGQ